MAGHKHKCGIDDISWFDNLFLEVKKVAEPIFKENKDDFLKNILETMSKDSSECVLMNPKAPSKSIETSLHHRKRGNILFKMNRLDQALEEYTKSVAYAPSGSEECALAFANRSAVLFKCQLMSDCISDIKNALCANYPDNLKAKLYHRKMCCLKALNPRDPLINKTLAKARSLVSKMDQDKQKAMMDVLDHETRNLRCPREKINCHNWNFEDTVPAFDANNPVVPGFCDAIEMKYSPQYGRHMVATRDIKPGELLGLQKPYTRVVADHMRYKLCWHCSKQTWSSIPCNTCGEVVFCSAVCRDEAHKKYHYIECWIMIALLAYDRHTDIMERFIFPLRLTIMAYKEAGNSMKVLKKNLEIVDAEKDPMKKGLVNGKFDPSKFSSIYCMESTPRSDDFEILLFTFLQSLIGGFLFCIKTGLHSTEENVPIKLNTLMNDNYKFIIEFIYKNMWSITYNSSVVQLPNGSHDIAIDVGSLMTPGAFFNHSCAPMITHGNFGEYFTTVSICPIKKGEQIFESYGPILQDESTVERQEHLKTYNFTCDCNACKYNLEPLFLDDIQSMVTPKDLSTIMKKVERWMVRVHQVTEELTSYVKSNNRKMDLSKDIKQVIKYVEQAWSMFPQKNAFPVLEAVNKLQILLTMLQTPILCLD